MSVENDLGREGRMAAQFDGNVAPILIQDVKGKVIHVRIRPLHLDAPAVKNVEDRSLGSTLDN